MKKEIEKIERKNILNKIQQELKAPKSQRNTFGNYNYRSCEDILEAVKPLLGEATLIINDEIVVIGDRYYVKATATLKNDKEEFTAIAYAREALDKKGMDASQITGATSSYARKYALNGLFLIDDTKDADTKDNTNIKNEISKELIEKINKTNTEEQLKEIWNANKGLGKEFAKLVTQQKEFILSVAKNEKEND